MDWQIFATRRQADLQRQRMRGWLTRTSKLTGMNGQNVWVIECWHLGSASSSNPMHLRRDGFVR